MKKIQKVNIKQLLQTMWADITAPDKENRTGFRKFLGILQKIGKWMFRLRSVLLAIPVAIAAVWLALYNMAHLPLMVGIDLQPSGSYSFMVDRSVAIMGPVALTAVCLLIMFASRRVLYPWLISLFSLAIPVLILLTNTFPG